MEKIQTESDVVYTVLIEGHGHYSQTYVFYGPYNAELFTRQVRQKVYPEFPNATGSDWSVYDPVKGFVQENATDAYWDFLNDAALEED